MGGKILVTGASGFLGSHVTKQLIEDGKNVKAAVRSPEKAEFLHQFGEVEIVQMDLLDLDSVKAAVDGCDDIIHCAAALNVGVKDSQREVVDPSIQGTKNLISAIPEVEVKTVIHTSSVAAIRPTKYVNGSKYGVENWCDDATLESNPYGLAKAGAERIIREWAEDKDVKLVTIHPSIIFGKPLQKRHMEGSMSYLKHFLSGSSFVLNVHINFVGVDDVARAHIAALDKGVNGKRYLIHSGGMWMRDVGLLLRKEFPQRKWAVRNLPRMLAYGVAIFHPKLRLKDMRDSIGTHVDYDSSSQFELLDSVKSPHEVIVDTMQDLLS